MDSWLSISFLFGQKCTVNFQNQHLWHHLATDYTIIISGTLKVMSNLVMYDRGAWFLRLIMSSSRTLCCLMSVKKQKHTYIFFSSMYNKTIGNIHILCARPEPACNWGYCRESFKMQNDIPLHEPPLQASSSPTPEIQIFSIIRFGFCDIQINHSLGKDY